MQADPRCEGLQVGWAPGGGESRGHESGRIIVELLQKEEDEYDEADFHHVSRVISYVHRHRAQGPSKHSVETSKWRYSPMNWWVDPHLYSRHHVMAMHMHKAPDTGQLTLMMPLLLV